MKIAFLAWGSLVWNTGELKISGKWENDGPYLPIEFARVSSDNRLTLVIYPKAKKVRTLWAYSAKKGVQESICNLAKREGTTTKNIGFVSIPDNICHCGNTLDILPTINSWAKQKQIDAVVWTDLPSTFQGLTPEKAIQHLKGLNANALYDAEIYVRKAPQQIRTEIRAILEKELGWYSIPDQEECDWTALKMNLQSRTVNESPDGSYWVVVPAQPATFGHLLVISWKGYQEQDIADKGLFRDRTHMKEMMKAIHDLAFEMKSSLTSNGETNGKRCERVYLVSECETRNFPFHFHLIPRFEGENEGHLRLFQQELEEARWMLGGGQEDEKVRNGWQRASKVKAIMNHHRKLLQSSRWARSNKEREEFVRKITEWWNKHLASDESN